MPRSDSAKARYAKYIAEGLCGFCGREANGAKRCKGCKQRDRDSRVRREEKRKAAGVCINHPSYRVKPGYTLCQKCIDKFTETSNARYKRNKENKTCRFCGNKTVNGASFCEAHKQKQKVYRKQLRNTAIDKYGGPICVGCGETEPVLLQVDHIGGEGNKHRRKIGKGNASAGSGYNFFLWLKNNEYPPGFRILCANCNIRALHKIPFPNEEAPHD